MEFSVEVLKYLKKNPRIAKSVVAKIEMCLGEYLFINVSICNKHELKGNCKGRWRLHVPYGHVVIYKIEGEAPNRYAHITSIMTEEKYHNWLETR